MKYDPIKEIKKKKKNELSRIFFNMYFLFFIVNFVSIIIISKSLPAGDRVIALVILWIGHVITWHLWNKSATKK